MPYPALSCSVPTWWGATAAALVPFFYCLISPRGLSPERRHDPARVVKLREGCDGDGQDGREGSPGRVEGRPCRWSFVVWIPVYVLQCRLRRVCDYVGTAGLARAENAVPDAPEAREGVVARLVAFVVVVVVVRHLGEWQPLLSLVGEVEVAADARVFLERLGHPKEAGEEEAGEIERHEDVSEHVANNRVGEVIEPVILVGGPRQRMVRVVVDAVYVLPEERDHVARAVHPVHAERHDVVVEVKLDHALEHELCVAILANSDIRRVWIVARDGIVEADIERELSKQGHPILEHERLHLLKVPAAYVLNLLELVLGHRLCAVLREREVASLEVAVVAPAEERGGPHVESEILQWHTALHIHHLWRQLERGEGEAADEDKLTDRVEPVRRQQQRREVGAYAAPVVKGRVLKHILFREINGCGGATALDAGLLLGTGRCHLFASGVAVVVRRRRLVPTLAHDARVQGKCSGRCGAKFRFTLSDTFWNRWELAPVRTGWAPK
mmetsp:Transcript_25399/g.59107  ORF Transcript_25399/g.59107 Transcript_25399/m.59107 type:complete len:499 (+) Transcript_25399:135-1631(+)